MQWTVVSKKIKIKKSNDNNRSIGAGIFVCAFHLHRWWISFAPNLGRCIIVSMENGLHRLGGVLVSQRINQIRAKWLRDVWEMCGSYETRAWLWVFLALLPFIFAIQISNFSFVSDRFTFLFSFYCMNLSHNFFHTQIVTAWLSFSFEFYEFISTLSTQK